MEEAAASTRQAAGQTQPAQPQPTGFSSVPHLHATEFSITASGGAIYASFGSARVVIDAEGPKGLLAKEWYSTIVMSPESFQQFLKSAQQVLEAYKKEWGSPPELPTGELRQEKGPPKR